MNWDLVCVKMRWLMIFVLGVASATPTILESSDSNNNCKFGKVVQHDTCGCLDSGVWMIDKCSRGSKRIIPVDELFCWMSKNGKELHVKLTVDKDNAAVVKEEDGRKIIVVYPGTSWKVQTPSGSFCAKGLEREVCVFPIDDDGIETVTRADCGSQDVPIQPRECVKFRRGDRCRGQRVKRQLTDPSTIAPVGAAPPASGDPAAGGPAPPASGDPTAGGAPPAAAGAVPPAAGLVPAAAGASPAAAAAAAGNSTDDGAKLLEWDEKEDEDTGGSSQEVAPAVMRAQMAAYLEDLVDKMISGGGQSADNEMEKRYPVFRLLGITRKVLQKTCPQIRGEYLKLALTSFLNVQLQEYHVTEPYLSYSSYTRIERALLRCLDNASPHEFIFGGGSTPAPPPPTADNTTTVNATTVKPDLMNITTTIPRTGYRSPPPPTYSEDQPDVPLGAVCDSTYRDTSDMIMLQGQERTLSMPDYGLGLFTDANNGTSVYEPLIETVWKMVLNAHSYCYDKFSDHYNDHHTFTVAMVPLFSNQIQQIWLPKYRLDNSSMMYGGLLGDIKKTLTDLNNCVSASRVIPGGYPWLMNRPHREKNTKRYKRDTAQADHHLCLENSQEFHHAREEHFRGSCF